MVNKDVENAAYDFTTTQDWFSFNIDAWRLLFPCVTAQSPRVLEIGSWEGRSAVFLLTELCRNGGGIVCIDHFDMMKTDAGRERYRKITHNLSLTCKPFRILDEFSVPALMILLHEEMSATEPGFDWIYVDGSHEADDTFLDGELAWRLARKGAVIIFDDYHWDKEPEDSVHHPKRGIDAFMQLHTGEYTVLSSQTQYQVILQKSAGMRIGFLMKDKVEHGLSDALGYVIHVALTVDTAYALAAAVAIRSAITHTSGRITFYVVDLGLTDKDKDMVRQSIPEHADVTIRFIAQPSTCTASEQGFTWAKIDMISVLPVERVLYLDADILVRGSLREIWDVDLKGSAVAAVVDVGYPMGHEGMERAPYFNAGVLLMNLALIRGQLAELGAQATKMKSSRFRDQDALNRHFKGGWLSLSLKWNAQGLGTYACLPSPDRVALDMSEMRQPVIVHFTGPVNPGVEHVLNPYIQPYTAKPWGYGGAPGHPFREEWWSVVEQTSWRGWRSSTEYLRFCKIEGERALKKASEDFKRRVEENIGY